MKGRVINRLFGVLGVSLMLTQACLGAAPPAGEGGATPEILEAVSGLKVREPEWRLEIVDRFANGAPKLAFLHEEVEAKRCASHEAFGVLERPVKRILFCESGEILEEIDLTVVEEGGEIATRHGTTIVPHGIGLYFFAGSSQVHKVVCFDRGDQDGYTKVFDEAGRLRHQTFYCQGHAQGEAISYHASGKIASRVHFDRGLLNGEASYFDEEGKCCKRLFYLNDQIEGDAIEWYSNGVEKRRAHYLHGELHAQAGEVAVVCFDDRHNLIESQDFQHGVPAGLHIRYHADGRIAYRVRYVNGKIEGKEEWFDPEGESLGCCCYKEGRAVGEQRRLHANGVLAYLALYDQEGMLTEPIREFDLAGKKSRVYSLSQSGEYEGTFESYHPNGELAQLFNYRAGELDGTQREYHADGQLKFEGDMVSGLKEGKHLSYFANGQIASQVSFHQGRREGMLRRYNERGVLIEAGYFRRDLPDGDHHLYYPDGNLHRTTSFANGVSEGLAYLLSVDGLLLFEGKYSCGHPVGVHCSFYPNGQKREIVHFNSQGERDGDCLGYYEDGQLAFEMHDRDGHPVGEQREFYRAHQSGLERPSGTHGQKNPAAAGPEPIVARIGRYDDEGDFDGRQEIFYEDGTPHRLISYRHGVLDGPKYIWDRCGELVEEAHYVAGRLEGRYQTVDAEGNRVIYHYRDNKKEGVYQLYAPSQRADQAPILTVEAHYHLGKLDGLFTEYGSLKQVISQIPYVAGLKEGLAQFFHRNGTVAVEVPFIGDQREGTVHQYDLEGRLRVEIPFKNDLESGTKKSFHPDGSLASTEEYVAGRQEGLARHHHVSGVLLFEGHYHDGLEHGRFTKYDPDGRLTLEQTFVEGQLHGVKKRYLADGRVIIKNYECGILMDNES